MELVDFVSNSQGYEAEQAVLGAVFLDQNALDEILHLEPRDFVSQTHQQIFKVMRYLHDNDKPVDMVTVTQEYVKFNAIEDIGGVEYFMKLSESSPTAANIKFHADIIRKYATKRRGIEAAEKIKQLSSEEFESDEEYFSAVEKTVSELRPVDQGTLKSISETRKQFFEHLNRRTEAILTGFHQYDNWSRGLGRGDLHILAGRPSVGKTAMLLSRAIGVAKNNAGPVLIFSQEMGEDELKERMVCYLSGVPFGSMKKREFSDTQWAKIEEAYDRLEALPIYIQDTPAVTIEEVRAKARQFKRKHGRIAFIAVDYLQIMKIPQSKSDTRALAIGRVTSAAKQLARELNCCFLMLSQMTRESEQKKKPQLSDLKESGSIEQDADVVEFLWYDPNDYEPGTNGKVVQQFIAKGRNIGINEFRLEFKGWRQDFQELKPKG